MEMIRAYIERFSEDVPIKLLYEVYGSTSEIKNVLQYCLTTGKTVVEVMKEENVYPIINYEKSDNETDEGKELKQKQTKRSVKAK
ncbi:hypothetical protein [Veillonella intestinalis]|uniref:hypothetical protein n=1 Tax=Veillonella intestinalis TaxID=2941341 RepID=UPI002041AD75|nr:hypothetical protein [Veillonella intestinalis]